jgi:hypothetical protein
LYESAISAARDFESTQQRTNAFQYSDVYCTGKRPVEQDAKKIGRRLPSRPTQTWAVMSFPPRGKHEHLTQQRLLSISSAGKLLSNKNIGIKQPRVKRFYEKKDFIFCPPIVNHWYP